MISYGEMHTIVTTVDLPTNADGERTLVPIAAINDRHLAAKERSRASEDLMCMAMVSPRRMRVGDSAFMRVTVRSHRIVLCAAVVRLCVESSTLQVMDAAGQN